MKKWMLLVVLAPALALAAQGSTLAGMDFAGT
jgi:hypothetical protein